MFTIINIIYFTICLFFELYILINYDDVNNLNKKNNHLIKTKYIYVNIFHSLILFSLFIYSLIMIYNVYVNKNETYKPVVYLYYLIIIKLLKILIYHINKILYYIYDRYFNYIFSSLILFIILYYFIINFCKYSYC